MNTNSVLDQIKARVEGHTEGPWVAQNLEREHGHRGIYWVTSEHEGSQVVAEIDANDGGVEAIWKFADAELIAAAPKLLAALEAVLSHASAEVADYQERGSAMSEYDQLEAAGRATYAEELIQRIEEALR